jgi:hypothetical protein
MKRAAAGLAVAVLVWAFSAASGEVCNVKVVTDASPDYSDVASMIHSIASKWASPNQKCWAVWYWNHLARRQTPPTTLHGMDLSDPIRQFNDYGYTMCSTVAGINCAIWHNMGYKVKYWDISLHTVPEVFYDDRWHMYDNSMSAIYTLCDGATIAGVEDIGKEGACEASGGKTELGHVAKYHCLTATSPNGFLTGADDARDLTQESRCFSPKALKYRYYYYDWDFGHRYILNLKDSQTYTRHYKRLGDSPEYYVPNNGKDPADSHARKWGISGNGVWVFRPSLAADWTKAIHSSANVKPADGGGLQPEKAGQTAEVVYKVQSANVTASQVIKATFARKTGDDYARILVSTNNGLKWTEVWKSGAAADASAAVNLVREVSGAYEVLVKIELLAKGDPSAAVLKGVEVTTTTQLNAKTQPRLNLGKNTVYVGTGDQTESVVFWPDLQADAYKEHVVDEKNVATRDKHMGYQGVLFNKDAGEAHIVYRLDAPGDITRLTYGGRFYNRAAKSHIDLLHSFDGGTTWIKSWTLSDTQPPWDVIHYETVDVPKGNRSVLVKYLLNCPQEGGTDKCSIYAVRMEADYLPAEATFKPIQVTFCWSERQKDRTLVERSHTQVVDKVPFRYTINVGGDDHPVMNYLRVGLLGSDVDSKPGYSDGKDAGGGKFVYTWLTTGKNLAVGKSYTMSSPSLDNWNAGDPEGRKLTDGVAGPCYAGGSSYRWGAIWKGNTNPVITVDLGEARSCASFGMNFHGYEWWDALKGEVKDTVEVLVSDDGKDFKSAGFLKTDIRRVDVPINFMLPDSETLCGGTFRFIPDKPVKTRYVQYKVTSKRWFDCTELEVLDSIKLDPFDIRIALPDEAPGK